MSVRIIITGGTIDDLEYKSPDEAPKNHTSLIPELLKQARVTLDFTVDELFQKDSRHITDEDREGIAKRCLECPEEKIVITHGTLTMPETAKFLGDKIIPKTIVLSGAAIPFNKEHSDALFNIGAAFSAVQLLPTGIYIAMNGKIFSWDNVKKNLDKGVFEPEQ